MDTATATLERGLIDPVGAASATTTAPRSTQTASRLQRVWRGNPDDPRWVRPSLIGLLMSAAVLYLWDLGASGMGNSFYAAAVQAGTKSWKALFFGSLDAGNSITVDKPAFSLWPMAISGRIFGFSSWSMLVPQALEGVATVSLLYAAVRRLTHKPLFGLLAGLACAVTPAAVLMFRFNNPDAMLVLLLTAAAYSVVRALQAASGRWLSLAGLLIGLGFITKMGEALLVVPALGLAYLVAAPTNLRTRIKHLAAAVGAMIAGAGWYIAIVDLWPANSRPYIGGSTNNSLLQLALGYNGIGRLFGQGGGSRGGGGAGPGGGGGGNSGFGGSTGLGRLFRGEMGLEISWLLPAALIALAAGFYLTRKAPRTDLRRAGLIAFGGGMLTTAFVFSEMKGVIHPYYTIALAPLIAATNAITGSLLWERRNDFAARLIAALLIETTVIWDVHLLGSWQPMVKVLVIIASLIAVGGILLRDYLGKAVVIAVAAAGLAGLGGSTAYAVSTASHPHNGSIPSAGPVTSSIGGGRGESGTSSNTALVALLKTTTTRWAAATNGSMSSAPLQLASGKAVMAIGGFNGSDNSPTLAQFEAWVKSGQIAYYVSGGGFGGGFGSPGGTTTSSASQIASWVAAHYTAQTVGGTTVYKLS